MRRAAKTDDNQAEIVTALRRLGAQVVVTSTVGQGFPDLVVAFRGRNILLEIKDGRKAPSARKLTPAQAEFHASWTGEVAVVASAQQAIDYLMGGPNYVHNGRM